MVLPTTETGEARAANRGRRSEKAFEIPERRPQKTVGAFYGYQGQRGLPSIFNFLPSRADANAQSRVYGQA